MIELFARPRRAERRPWEMFFIGLLYSLVALAMVGFIFSKDTVLSQYGGMLVVLITVLCCWPFMYYIIKLEEGKDLEIDDEGKLVKEHSKAIIALIWLFLGLIIGFSMWYVLMPHQNQFNFNAQTEIFCAINSGSTDTAYNNCLSKYGLETITGKVTTNEMNSMLAIFANNVSVLIFTLIFSLALGAGAIFILVWNASVIGAAIGMFANTQLSGIPLGFLRYMIHGIPEIAAYFIAALAGGIISVAIIRKDIEGSRKWNIMQDAIMLVIIALIILLLSAIVEVFFTPTFMKNFI